MAWGGIALSALVLGGLASSAVWGQSGKLSVKKVSPPPKWESRILRMFFADATKEVGPGQPGAARPAANNLAASTSGAPGGASAVAAGGYAWSKLIDAETLEAEIKSNINALTTAVDNPSKFKAQHFRKARGNYSNLGLLFGVVATYDGDVKWKDKAASLRDGTAKAGFNCKVGTDQSFNDAKARYEELQELLRGGTPKLSEAEPTAEWAKVADRSELMKRMEEAGQAHLTPWTSNENEFKSNADKVLHEAQLLSVMAQVIQHPSYELADDEGYLKHAAALQQACQEIADAAKQGNFAKAQAAAGNMSKSCANCHTDYR